MARTRDALYYSWDKNDPKDTQVLLHLLKTGVTPGASTLSNYDQITTEIAVNIMIDCGNTESLLNAPPWTSRSMVYGRTPLIHMIGSVHACETSPWSQDRWL